MKTLLSFFIMLSLTFSLQAQVAINTDGTQADGSAMLDVKSDTAGILIPRMTAAQRDAINNPANGLMVFVTTDNKFWYFNGTQWINWVDAADNDWTVSGNDMYAVPSGNVGIGTTTPSTDLDIKNDVNAIIKLTGNSGLSEAWISRFTNRLHIASNDKIYFGIGGQTSANVSINSSGNVGIGTLDAAQKLQITGGNDASLSNGSGYMILGEESGQNIVIDNNEIMSRDNAASANLYIQCSNSTANTIINKEDGKVGIGTSNINSSAKLQVNSMDKGFLPPRMTSPQMNAIVSPAEGLMVYNTSLKSICFYDGTKWKNAYNKEGESCGDITYGGQTYQTVVIGTQCWMAENLNVGTMINGSNSQTNNSTIEKYCYDNNLANCDTYGGLYLWDEMMQYVTTESTQGICPTGWHLPTDAEWKSMEIYLGMSQTQADGTGDRGTDEGGKLKETDTTHWSSPNTGATNSSSFTGLPAGNRSPNGSFLNLSYFALFWSSSEYSGTRAWYRGLYNYIGQVERENYDKTIGVSVRCIKD